ncbi:hypothetical protein T11_13814 [Trichinella zimbabwensis]|uniref:Uncharacterized protein n=1 Tax=Trichinella zimbabwensis TaxID=268475 RepID=A0A0V1DT84_9BILA|nr:hypothetical protein T11_13814 [Trichinella zimbabwensis]
MPRYNMNKGNALLNSTNEDHFQNINYRTENATTKNSVSQNTPRHV